MNHSSISEIRDLLDREGLALKKRFGQNFLTDEGVRRRISECILNMYRDHTERNGDRGGEIWEIGPGLGSLTDLLVAEEVPIRLFEIDRGIISLLRRRYAQNTVVVPIEEGDFIVTGPEAIDAGHKPVLVCGNLPYASASSIVAKIIETPIPIGGMVFMVQSELADRFQASVGTKAYSALSVLVQNHYTTRALFTVPGGAFYPRPHVGSKVIAMEPIDLVTDLDLDRMTSEIARTAFSSRRKTLRNTLKGYLPALEAVGIDPGLRPERVTPGEFVAIAREVMRDRTPS